MQFSSSAICAAVLILFPVYGQAAEAQMMIGTHMIATDVHMPVIMIGTWTSGTTENAEDIVRTWLSQGGRGIDEAIVYDNQALAAKAINESGVARRALFIESKVPQCGGEAMTRSWIQQCLSELKTQYLDLLLIHAPQGPDCLGTWRVLEEYHARGILKSIGVSNFQIPQLEALLAHAKVKPAVNQIQFNVFFHDDALAAYCKEQNITVQSWGPLGGAHHWFHRSVFTEPAISSIARTHKVTNAQVALRWVLQHVPSLVVLSGSRVHQLNDADVFKFELSPDEMTRLDALQRTLPTVQKSSASLSKVDLHGFKGHPSPWNSWCQILFVAVSTMSVFAAVGIWSRSKFRSRAPNNSNDVELSWSTEPVD